MLFYSKVIFAILFSTIITTAIATFDDLDLDLSNLDISKHKFFKNFPDLSRKPDASMLDHIGQHFEKKKAVALYFGRLLFGTPQDNEVVGIQFDPNYGYAWRPYYERRYGYRGESLIDSIGKGYSPGIKRSMSTHKVSRQSSSRKSKKSDKSDFRIFYY